VEEVFGGQLRACDLGAGQLAWERELGQKAELVASDPRHVLVRSSERVWALDVRSGAVRWQIEGANRGVALLDDRVLLRSGSDRVLTHSLADGRRTAAASFVLPSSRPFANIQHPLGVLLAQVEYPPDGVDAVDAAQGNLLWQLSEPTTAAAANPLLVFTHEGWSCANNALTARLAQTAAPVWSIPWCPALSNVSADHDLVVTLSYESEWSRVVARRPADGHPLWSRRQEP
jgi:outer membrane protein assembly factor BamB